jgi:hypothetical protein
MCELESAKHACAYLLACCLACVLGPPLLTVLYCTILLCAGLTDVTHGSFDKLVSQLERGFEDMHKCVCVGCLSVMCYITDITMSSVT